MTSLLTKGVKIHSINDIDIFNITVNDLTFSIIRKKLEIEREKIINFLKNYQEKKIIKSLAKPKSKDREIQLKINQLIHAKNTIDHTTKIIQEYFYK